MHVFNRSLVVCIALSCAAGVFAGADPFADVMIDYQPGTNPAPGYSDPHSAIGSPERFTGEGFCDECPSVVSPFSGPYGFTEIVSIGAGGRLVIRFDEPVLDDPNNLYGIDLLIFGNTSLFDMDYPNGLVGGIFGNDGGTVEVSDDGEDWHLVPDIQAEALFPTVGYLDSGPYSPQPGSVESDFTRPVDPAMTLDDFMGLTTPDVVEKYRGSGGGVGVDLAAVGLRQITHVRIAVPAGMFDNVEIDAFSDVAPRQPGDVDLDDDVDVDDLLLLISSWGSPVPGGPPSDFDLDGDVDVDDLLTVISNWGS